MFYDSKYIDDGVIDDCVFSLTEKKVVSSLHAQDANNAVV